MKLSLTFLTLLSTALASAPAPVAVDINLAQTYQEIDGFGFSEAFQRANDLYHMPEAGRRKALDLLFHPTKGAGFSIIRNGIGSSPNSSSNWMNSIEPVSPGGPNSPPHYVWDRNDSSQFWFAQQAVSYGVKTIYADAWSAPGFMKTNDNENYGGYLCGVRDTNCASGDWRQAYANYLVQYIKFYKESGIDITHVGFLNEPEYNPGGYAGMLSSGFQAADFIKVLYPTIQRAGLSTQVKIACCDSEGWDNQVNMTAEIQQENVEDLLGIITSHSYTSWPTYPINTKKNVWITESADLNGLFAAPWYNNSDAAEGLTWAQNLHTAIVDGHVSAYLYWEGVEVASSSSSHFINVANGQPVTSSIYWALAQFSRFIRPGAVRVGTSSGSSSLSTSAYQNKDGSLSVQIVNNGAATPIQLQVSSRFGKNNLGLNFKAYVTDNSQNIAPLAIKRNFDGTLTVNVPDHSLVTVTDLC
ncbi:beta-1,6-glucanase Neg1 [Sugiyamaella lignohabitans]|uniref:Beta-1,6-glucanase Neg1 n=1 Tax=Sugiyamaella lignohabitans TaxID=796027 RepID=A0A161HKM6_9ASCO|nr:beta-1,6-glucanase Neg1 [Sugiyamaella lignohabitans]ANB12318.1 beta-1,6-glucanase Neg1 [Sugiyamaella lignohabitans]